MTDLKNKLAELPPIFGRAAAAEPLELGGCHEHYTNFSAERQVAR